MANGHVAANGDDKALTVPVVRDQRYQHYSPDRFSIMRRTTDGGEKYEIRLQSVVHRELSQSLNLSPDGEGLGVTRRDVRIEVVEWAGVELTLQQMTRLRDEFSRAIQASKPRPEHVLRDRLMQLTAQIDVAETELARRTRDQRPPDTSAEAREIAALSSRVDALMQQVTARAELPPPPARPTLFDHLPAQQMTPPMPEEPRRSGIPLYALGGLCLLGLGATAGWLAWASTPSDVLVATREDRMPPASRIEGPRTRADLGVPPRFEAPPPAPEETAALPPPAPVVTSSLRARPPVPAPSADEDAQASEPSVSSSPLQQGPAGKLPEPSPRQSVSADPPKEEASAEPSATQAQSASAAPSVVAAPARQAEAAPVPAFKAAPEPANAHVEIRASGTTWLRVRDPAGKVYLERVLKAGETWSVPQVPGLQMTTGNAGVTSLIVNGTDTAPFGAVGAVWAGSLTR